MAKPIKRMWNNTKLSEHTKMCRCTGIVSMAASLGLSLHCRNISSTPFTCTDCDLSWMWNGRTKLRTPLSWWELESPACISCRSSDACYVSATWRTWSPKIICVWQTNTGGKWPTSKTQLHHRDVCRREMEALDIEMNSRESSISYRTTRRQVVGKSLPDFEEILAQMSQAKRQRLEARQIPLSLRLFKLPETDILALDWPIQYWSMKR